HAVPLAFSRRHSYGPRCRDSSPQYTSSRRGKARIAKRQIAVTMIFVSIASYTDPELPRTLRDCVDNARWPDDLRFGICWQGAPAVPVSLDAFRADRRFLLDDCSIAQSEGGTWARSRAQRLWSGEEFTLQIDSHTKFEPRWDERVIAMLEALPGRKPLLTVNSPLFWWDDEGHLHRDTARGVPTTRVTHWAAAMGWAPWFDFGPPYRDLPGRNRFISGNFVFTLGRWNEDVPQDPDHYYWGEEFSLTVRSFTSGYDPWAPREIVVWHMLHRHGPPRRHWEHGQHVVEATNAVAFERLRRLHFIAHAPTPGRHC